MRYFLVAAALIVPAFGYPGDDCRLLHKTGKRSEARNCFQKLTSSSTPAARAEGLWGISQFKEANTEFRAAVAAQPANADVRVRWGRLFLERFNKAEAHQLFKEALTI